jgi:hypothetical protein
MLFCMPIFLHAQSDTYALQRILQRYTEAYGGFRDADALTSLSVEGSIEQDGQLFEFLMRRKRPDSIRYRLSNASSSVITGYNGSTGWIRVQSHGDVSIETLDAKQLSALRRRAKFESPLFRHLEKRENEISLVERATYESRNVYVLKVRESSGQTSHYYIDSVTVNILRQDFLDDAGEIVKQTFYRDYKDVEGFPFAHEIEERVGGATVSLAKVNTIEVNPGLLSFYFEKPKR